MSEETAKDIIKATLQEAGPEVEDIVNQWAGMERRQLRPEEIFTPRPEEYYLDPEYGHQRFMDLVANLKAMLFADGIKPKDLGITKVWSKDMAMIHLNFGGERFIGGLSPAAVEAILRYLGAKHG